MGATFNRPIDGVTWPALLRAMTVGDMFDLLACGNGHFDILTCGGWCWWCYFLSEVKCFPSETVQLVKRAMEGHGASNTYFFWENHPDYDIFQ